MIIPVESNTPNPTMTKFIFATELTKSLKNTIHLADTKANIVLTIQTFLISTILAATIIEDIFKEIKEEEHLLKYGFLLFLIIFLIVSIIGLVLAVLVFIPRKSTLNHHEDARSVTYYADIKSFGTSLDYYKAVNTMTDNDLVEELAVENYNLSFIISKKMDYTRKAILALFTSIMLAIIIVFFVLAIK